MTCSKKHILVLLFFLMANGAYAQYTEEEGGIENESGFLRYLGIGAGATYQVMNDPAISPVIYSKISGLPMISNVKVSQSVYNEISLRASMVNLTHNTDKLIKVKTKTRRAMADYRFMLSMPSDKMAHTDIRAGAILSGMFMHKTAPHLDDAYKVYEYAASFGLTGRLVKELTLGEKTSFFSWDIAIPVVANIGRPAYLNKEEIEDPENKPVSEFLSGSYTGSFGRFFRLNSRLSLMYRLDNGNIVQLAYEWDYTRSKSFEKSYYIEHLVSVLFMFNY